MNEMTTFDFCDSLHQNHPVRMIEQNGEPWWVLKDVCEALNLKNATLVAKRLDNDELTKFDLGSRQGETIIVNEPGLYSVVLRSDKPEAKMFKRWLTHEVIPSIRKTGSYGAPAKTQQSDLIARVEALEKQLAPAQEQTIPLWNEDDLGPGICRDRNWFEVAFRKLDLLSAKYGTDRKVILSSFYRWIKNRYGIDINKERENCEKAFRLKECSGITAVWYNANICALFELEIDRMLGISYQGEW